MSGQIKANQLQLGDSSTATQNFVLQTNVDGTAKLARGNAGATTQDLIHIDASGNVALNKTASQSMVRLNTANGYGSTNTHIRRFTNVITNQGSDVTYADSATLGASFTINTAGVYSIMYSDSFSSNTTAGISLNSTQLSTAMASITLSDVLAIAFQATNAGLITSWTGFLPAGSVVRAHAAATGIGTTPAHFNIVRVA